MAHLPGQSVGVSDDEWGTKCYSHPDVEATHRICVESDSFGSEYANLCDVCWEERNKAIEEQKNDPEQWEQCKCGNREPRLISYRDMDEGMHGPVYEHCSVCHAKMNARIAAEEEYYNDDDDYDYCPDGDIDMYDPAPHYENLSPEEMQAIADHLKTRWKLNFEIDSNALVFKTNSNKVFRKFKRHFHKFCFMELDNGFLTTVDKIEGLSDVTAEIEMSSWARKTNDRKLEAKRNAPKLTLRELVQLTAEGKKQPKTKLGKFITPEYTLHLEVALMYSC